MANSDSPQASTVPPPENSSEKSAPSTPAKSPPPPEKSSTSPESSPSSSSEKTPSPTSPPPPPSSHHPPTPPAKSEESSPAPPPPTADPPPVSSTPADPTPPEDSNTPSNPSPKPKPTPSRSRSQPSEDSVPAESSTPASPGDNEGSQSHDPTTKFSPPSNNGTQLPSNLVPSPPGVPSPPTTSGTPSLSPPSTATPSQSGNDRSATSSKSVPAVDPFVSSVSNDTDHREAITSGVVIGILGALLLVGLIAAILYLRNKKKTTRRCKPPVLPSPYSSSQSSGPIMMHPHGSEGSSPVSVGLGNSKWFTYEELSLATNGFSSHSILGSGGFGYVYKGVLEDGREVAVKKLKAGGGQGDREFKSEVEIISRVHHRHLVSLVGYCINGLDRVLVYEFVANNTLHHHLHGSGQPVMGWPHRVKVVAGSAKGIAYLHEDCHPRIIHRDIKSANILLDTNYEAKVADFGLAKLAQELDANTHVSTRVMGTFGYMAPEYAASGKLSEKSDVFSFGVVVLELITGRKPVDENQPLGEESLVEWARPLLTKALDTEDFEELADPRLGGDYDRAEMFRMTEAAAACVRHSAANRPKMSQLARALDFMNEPSPDLLKGMKPGESEIINSREQSAQIRMFQRMPFDSQDASSSEEYSSQGSWRSDRSVQRGLS